MLCDMREQAGASEKISEDSSGRILLNHLDEVLCEHPLLPHERERSRKIEFMWS